MPILSRISPLALQPPSSPLVQIIITYCQDYQNSHLICLPTSLSLLKSILIASKVMLLSGMPDYAIPLLKNLLWLSHFFLK